MREIAEKNQKKMKEAMLDHANRKARAREFSEGAMVWVRTPGLSGKIDASWEGSFQVLKKCNKVNYTVDVPGRRTKVVHVNDLKEHVAEDVVCC